MNPFSNIAGTTRRGFLKATTIATTGGLLLSQTGIALAQGAAGDKKSKIQGTKTEQNLLKAFAGESQARNRYTFFADKAREDGYMQIAAIFEETAEHERSHAKRFFSFLKGGAVDIQAAFPAGVVGGTEENLKAAAAGEHEEWSILYPEFGKIAGEEGFPDVEKLFKAVAVAEQMHENRYLDFLKNIEEDIVFARDEPVLWQCRNCGYTHKAREPEGSCPACAHPQSYFQLFVPNW